MGVTMGRGVRWTDASPATIALALMFGAAPVAALAQDQAQTGTEAASEADEEQIPRDLPPGDPNTAPFEPGAGGANAPDQVAGEPDEMVITGFRRSLENAIETKRSADLIVESISAEDIGKLPDDSIAESIARLPGLTSQRLSGRAQVISIRGFAPDFSTTLLNGREQTSTGDNRAVEYDQYPSEVVNQVNVYKSPTASLIGQGLSGTVDLRTIRPLEFGRRVFSVGARGEYTDLGKLNPESEEFGYRVQATYVDQYANDTIGLALAASYIDAPYQIQEFNAWGYADVDGNAVIGGTKPFVTSTTLERLGLQGTLEVRPHPNFVTTFDAFYSDFKDDQIKRGIEFPLGFGDDETGLNIGAVEDGLVVDGAFTNVEGVVRNDVFQREADLYSFGWNLAWVGDDGWSATGDISFSKTDRNELIFESNAGTGRGRGVGAADTIGFNTGNDFTTFNPGLNYSDPNLILLTSPLGWGGTQIDPNGPDIRGGQDGYYNNRVIEDELWQFRVDIEKEAESRFLSSVKVGANYTKRDKSLTPEEFFLGLAANTDGETSVPVPQEFLLEPTNLDYLGLGPVLSYDPLALLDAGIYNLVPNNFQDVVTKGFVINEDIMTLYGQFNIGADLGTTELTGNIGAQAVFTDQRSSGFASTFAGTDPATGAPIINTVPISGGDTYVDLLPSLNLSLRFPSDFVIRFAASRQLVRPRLDELRIAREFGANEAEGIVAGEGGNPELRPWRANALDLTFEKYFGGRGYLAAQFFYKDLKSYIYTQDVPFNFAGLPVGPTSEPVSLLGRLTLPSNGEGGELYGVELAGTLPFEVITPALEGFGLTGGGSYTKTEVRPNPDSDPEDLPGYSEWVANGTAFFERWGFSARASIRYRSSFIGELSGFGAVRERRRARDETILDAQLGYDFSEESVLRGLSIFVQGQNLTDEPFVTTAPSDDRLVIDYQTYGRRYLAGFNMKF